MARPVASSTPAPLEHVGGINCITVAGTPRQMGHAIGQRLAARIQMCAQDCLAYVCRSAAAHHALCHRDGRVQIDRCLQVLEEVLQPSMAYMQEHAPHIWMELESIAAGAQLTTTHIMAIHALNDVLPALGTVPPVCASASIMLPAQMRDNNQPTIALQWRMPAFLHPHLCLVRRIPAHGPATLTFGFNGLHTVAGLSEAGNALVSNDMHCVDADLMGIPIPCILDHSLSSPTVDDALLRLDKHRSMGSRAIFVLHAQGQRASLEMSAQTHALFNDITLTAPRIHTSHPIHQAFALTDNAEVEGEDGVTINNDTKRYAASKTQLRYLARTISHAQPYSLVDISQCLHESAAHIRTDSDEPMYSCVCIFEPQAKIVHCHNGSSADNFGSTHL